MVNQANPKIMALLFEPIVLIKIPFIYFFKFPKHVFIYPVFSQFVCFVVV